jgi:hypothetical protein
MCDGPITQWALDKHRGFTFVSSYIIPPEPPSSIMEACQWETQDRTLDALKDLLAVDFLEVVMLEDLDHMRELLFGHRSSDN